MPNETVRAATKYLDENYPTTVYDEQTIISAGKDFMSGYDKALDSQSLAIRQLQAEVKVLREQRNKQVSSYNRLDNSSDVDVISKLDAEIEAARKVVK